MAEEGRRGRQAQREEDGELVQRGRREEQNDGPVGVVLAGAGARGAYEAGMLSELLPELDKRGQRPSVFVGTSAGAINAVLFASLAHLTAGDAAREAVSMWRSMRKNQIFRPVLPSGLAAAARYLASLANLPVRLTGGLLDTQPLLDTLSSDKKLNWPRLRDNMSSGKVEAVAVVTTVCRTGRTEIFVQGHRAGRLDPGGDADRAVDYVNAQLEPEHVLASAAMPVLFPPVRITTEGADGWYMDGGVRLNAPIKPAIALGVKKVVVIATDPAEYLARPLDEKAGPPPMVQDTFAQLLKGALVDRMIEDLHTLTKINELVGGGAEAVKSRTGRQYRVVERLFAGPAPGAIDELGQLANTVFTTDFAGARAIAYPDLWLLGSLLGPTMSRGELLSYLFFEPEFVDQAIELGQRDARRILAQAGNGDLWKLEE